MAILFKRTGLLVAAILAISALRAIDIPKLYCESVENPIGIQTLQPRLGWQLHSEKKGDLQTRYHIIVSSTASGAAELHGDRWDSGEMESSQSQGILYRGAPLEGGKEYYWRVRVWDAEGVPSPWSDIARWEQAPDREMLNAQWIGAIDRPESKLPVGNRTFHSPSLKDSLIVENWGEVPELAKHSIQLRKPVLLDKPVEKAVIYISGLGHYELTINGCKVDQSQFAPFWSDYDKTVYYNIYSVEEWLRGGENVLGVLLGNGFYNVAGTRYRKLWVTFGPPTLFFQMQVNYQDGTRDTFYSDSSWKWAESPLVFNDLFGGEDYDARLEQPGWDQPGFEDSAWKQAVVQAPPSGKLTTQLAPPVKIMQTFPVKTATQVGPHTRVFDMGQNLSGFPTVTVQGKPGQTIRLIPGESLNPDGTVNQRRTGSPHYYEYTLKSDRPETWTPRFSYYGYQYIEVPQADYLTGSGERPVIRELISNWVYNSVEETGTFESSNEIFNQAHWLINNAIKSNMQAVFTDCPHREKLGWIEQVHLNGPGIYYNYDVARLIPKSLQDMADGQRANGLVPSIVPEYTDFTAQSWGADFADSPEWGAAICVTPWQYYEYYGDPSMIHTYYPNMQRYVDYLGTRADRYIVSHGLGDWYDYGEHRAGYSKNSPISLSATSHWYLCVLKTIQSAQLVGDQAGVEKYMALADRIKEAYNREFYNPQTKQYAIGSQFSNAISIYLDLVPPADKQAVLDHLVADIHAHGTRLTTGDVGNRYLFRVLADNGYEEVLYDMLNHYDAPGYGYQLAYGLTTLTEQWDPSQGNSWNHFMMGQLEEWLYGYLAGIRSVHFSGFREILFAPQVVGDMTYAKATHRTKYGTILSEWKLTDGRWEYRVQVPVNCTATVVLPKGFKNAELDRKSISGDRVAIGSGSYTITCQL
ncbi:MAG: glycoside hydrolase family 78 protein [Rikenellaceae bacterium]|nr:glycoside hydrolase family 78 protein [Rikenellaceae bacterium]